MNIKHLCEILSGSPSFGSVLIQVGYKNFAIFDQ